MLGMYISGPVPAFIYALVASFAVCLISLVIYKFSYHDEEDDKEWDEATAFVMDWEPDMVHDDK